MGIVPEEEEWRYGNPEVDESLPASQDPSLLRKERVDSERADAVVHDLPEVPDGIEGPAHRARFADDLQPSYRVSGPICSDLQDLQGFPKTSDLGEEDESLEAGQGRRGEEVIDKKLQDVQIGARRLQNGAGPLQVDGAGLQDGADDQPPQRLETTIPGVVRVRNRTQPADTAQALERPNLRELLHTCPANMPEAIINLAEADAWVLDIDNHEGQLSRNVVEAHISTISPEPNAWFVTHRDGAKLVYVGDGARTAALIAAMSVPPALTVELKQDMRHPLATYNLAPDKKAGEVHYVTEPYRPKSLLGLTARDVDPAQRDVWLAEQGMVIGGRYDHSHCPIAPEQESGAANPVVVYDTGVMCFVCRGHDRRFAQHLRPGFVSFAELTASTSRLVVMARNRVHWTHAKLQLTHYFPNLDEGLLKEIYETALHEMYADDDPRVPKVFSADLHWLRGEDCWLWANSLTIIPHVDDDFASSLPYCQALVVRENAEPKVTHDRARRHCLKHGRPDGYMPVRIIRPPLVEQPEGAIALSPLGPQYPIELLDDPMPEEEAFDHVGQSFPGLIHDFLMGLQVAVLCILKRGGRPPMIWPSGPTGSAKEQTTRLVGSFIGELVPKIAFLDDEEKFYRSIGTKLLAGHRILMVDELGKVRRDCRWNGCANSLPSAATSHGVRCTSRTTCTPRAGPCCQGAPKPSHSGAPENQPP
ncbi:MAG: hypothetical protein HQ546_09140 [Planctomycetes bacterium]|nr:hypothetical protein [Planctomycetota bacterium]